MTKSGRATATINGTTVASATSWEEVENNVYFPPSSIKREYFTGPTGHSTHCPWKGDASYYDINVGGDKLGNAAWYYPKPKDAAKEIKDHVAFYKSKVTVSVE